MRSPGAIALNDSPGNCYRCQGLVLVREGEYYENPLRLICPVCSLREGFRDNGLARRLEEMPLLDDKGKEWKLRSFQEADAKILATVKAHLVGHQMGLGKTPMSSVAVLRPDTGNLIFTPSSVKLNWQEEIDRWRPDLDVTVAESQDTWRSQAPDVINTPGAVLIASFGLLPGTPCSGCRSLRKKLKALKKEKNEKGSKRYDGPIPDECMHYTPAEVHPRKFTATIDGREKTFDYHDGCEGCHQDNPIPRIDRPVLLLADECHAFKNPRTIRTRNWRGLRRAIWSQNGYVFGLSGTPCEGKPPEFWEVLVSLGLERAAFGCWNNYYNIFRDWYDNKKGARKPPKGELKDELHKRLKLVMVRRRSEEVLKDLPPVIEKVIDVDLDEKTIKAVNEAVHHMLAVRAAWNDVVSPDHPSRRLDNPMQQGLTNDERDRRRGLYDQRIEEYFQERPWNTDEEIVAAVHEALVTRDNMPSIEELSRIRSMLSQAKVAAVKEWMQSCEDQCEPTIVFSAHVQILRKLMDRPGWECFDGSLSPTARHDLVTRFQSGQIENGMGVSIRAGGEGITLTRARVCGYIDVSWNPAKNAQSLARLRRIGSEGHDSIVVVYFRARHIVDRLVQQTIFEKETIMDALNWDSAPAA
jgi:SNF2 family DNA or RNA helicase